MPADDRSSVCKAGRPGGVCRRLAWPQWAGRPRRRAAPRAALSPPGRLTRSRRTPSTAVCFWAGEGRAGPGEEVAGATARQAATTAPLRRPAAHCAVLLAAPRHPRAWMRAPSRPRSVPLVGGTGWARPPAVARSPAPAGGRRVRPAHWPRPNWPACQAVDSTGSLFAPDTLMGEDMVGAIARVGGGRWCCRAVRAWRTRRSWGARPGLAQGKSRP